MKTSMLYAATLLGIASTLSLSVAPSFSASEDATAYRTNIAHTAQATMPDFVLPVSVKWDVTLPGPIVTPPIIAGGDIFVLTSGTASGSYAPISAYELSAKNGSTIWGPVVLPTALYEWATESYDNGMLFVCEDASNGSIGSDTPMMIGINSSTGKVAWSTGLSGQLLFNTDYPTATNGNVFVQCAGNVNDVNETTGALTWATSQLETGEGALAVSGNGLYISGGCGDTYSLNESTGADVWSFLTGCEGGGGYTCAYYNGDVFIQDYYDSPTFPNGSAAIDATTGALVKSFTSGGFPAFDDGFMFDILNNALTATNLTSWSTTWTASDAVNAPATPPTVVNGDVYVATSTGLLNGYNETTGARDVSVPLGVTPSDQTLFGDLQAGDGIIVVSNGAQLVAVGTPFAQLTASTSPTAPNGSNGWFTVPVKVTLSTTAGTIYYAVDGGATETYSSPFTVSGDDKHAVTYWAADGSGDATVPQTLDINIDATAPTTSAVVAGSLLSTGAYAASAAVTLNASDNLSGVAGTSYELDGGAVQAYTAPIVIQGEGSHTLDYFSTDKAGNVESSKTLKIAIGPAIVHTFPAGLQMIAGSEDYSAKTFAEIFDTPPTAVAVWNQSTFNYVVGPKDPADTIRPGEGYWVRLASTGNLLDVGIVNDPTVSLSIPLQAGWNIIGDPWATAVGLGALSVIDGSGHSYPVGVGSLVAPTLYTYQAGDTNYETLTPGGALQPFEGYWVYAYQSCTLQFPGTPGGPPNPFAKRK